MKMLTKASSLVACLALAGATVLMADNPPMPAPGAVNYVEGQVALNGQDLSSKSVGSASLESGQTLQTGNGNVEMLLTPGVFLRLGHNSEVRMISPGLADTRVELLSGTAMLEVSELFRENNIGVVVNGSTTRILSQGLYEFTADRPTVSVIDGKAVVYNGDAHLVLKKGHSTSLAQLDVLKEARLDKNEVASDPLYLWSKLRSEYQSQANVDAARTIVDYGGWYGPGWYWDPFWDFYAFMPGDGILYSPFGWGYFSPGWVGYAPVSYYPYRAIPGHGYLGRTMARSYAPGGGRAYARPMAPAMRMGGFGGGFRGGFGGGFHGGGMARGR